MTTQEQAKVFKHLYDKLGTAIISLDCTSDGGRAIADELVILGIPDEHIVRCMFNANMTVGFETDVDGKAKRDTNGKPIERKEKVIDWACQRLEHLLYNGLVEVPYDPKFLKEFASYLEIVTGNVKRYGSSSTDHLVQSWQCFGIAQFLNEFNLLKSNIKRKRFLGIVK